MEYLVLIYRDESQDATVDLTTMTDDYAVYTQAIAEAGVLRGGERLMPSSTATSITFRDGQQVTTDGPYAEAREQLGGYYVLECADLDEALMWAAKCPGANHGTVELRPIAPMVR